jgi:serine-type D-Ala-D-Ala carboxypeptidase
VSGAEEVFGSLARRAIAEGAFPGAALRIEGRDGLLFEGCWGDTGHSPLADSSPTPLDPSTLFDLASLSKLFTATAVLRLANLGRLSLGDRVAGLYRRYSEPLGVEERLLSRLEGSLGEVDLAALLSHSSGIHYWYPFYASRGRPFESILADVLEAHPPTGQVVYSDLNFMILGRLVEGLSGKPFPDAMRDLVFSPLGLGRSSYGRPLGSAAPTEFGNRIERSMVADLGLSFDGWRDEAVPIQGEPDDGNCHYFFHGAAGHAGVFSDLGDLCRLGLLYLKGGRANGEAFLAPALAEEALRDRRGGRGLGFQLGDNYPGGGAGHTGFTGTYLHVNLGSGLVIALLASRLHEPRPRDINPIRREFSRSAISLFG